MAKDSYPDIQNCQRIEKDTSGVLVMAKIPEAYRHLSLQFQNREVQKIYHAVVHGQSENSLILEILIQYKKLHHF